MGLATGRLPRDPLRGPVDVGDAAIQGHRRLERDVRPAAPRRREKHAVLANRLIAEHADGDVDASRAERLETVAVHAWIGIAGGDDDAANARRDNSRCARRRATVMHARLQGHVERSATSVVAGSHQCDDLRVRASGRLVESLTNDRAACDDDGADQWIRGRETPRALGAPERTPHEAFVGLRGHAGGTSASTKRSASKEPRSSTFSPTPTSLMGSLSSRTIRTTMPPLAVPSSLVRMTPLTPIVSWNIRAWATPFWPVGASSTMRLSCGAPGSWRSMTFLSLASSAMRFDFVCRRPAVSMMSVSTLRAVAAFSASNTTAPGSEPAAWRMTSTPIRPPTSPAARWQRRETCPPPPAAPACPRRAAARATSRPSASCPSRSPP